MEKIFACKECGQVYRDNPPKECMRHNCNSVKFEEIQEEDVINIHDVPEYLLNMVIKKVSDIIGLGIEII